MKKIIMIFVLMLTLVNITLAENAMPPIEIPAGGISDFFISLAAMIPLIVFITGWLTKILNPSGAIKQIISWLVSVVLAIIAWALNLGIFEPLSWYIAIVYGLAAGLGANGIFDIKLIQKILDIIFKPKKAVK